ncbi:MAG: excinuclease ABC subunit UvrA [Isosphaeraceae bacterium]|nr:excinuclease ABC subunit UvrA [Isosphaeraceae bacterium]
MTPIGLGAMAEHPDDDGEAIRVRGARVHNLRDIDVDLPRDRLVVLTGVSGSGKSSLAFDTLYAEGQRRYIESLSSYARQFLDQLQRPDVDLIDGLPPTVAIDQRAGAANPRSTVATVTEIHDYLRLLYARTGVPHCPDCGQPIRRQTPEQMVAGALALPEGRKVLVLAPLVRGRKGEHHDAFQAVRREGLIRVRVDGQVLELRDDPKLARTKPHDIEAVVDRLVVREGIRPRLAESIDLALKLGQGTVILSIQNDQAWDDRVLSIHFACPACGAGFEELEPRTFSFNSPYGACRACDGLGVVSSFDPELVVPDRSRSVANGAIAPWSGSKERNAFSHLPGLDAYLKRNRLKASTPLAKWTSKAVSLLLEGEPGEGFMGVLPQLQQQFEAAKTERQRAALTAFRAEVPCPACLGARLRPEARAVTVAGRPIHEVQALAVAASRPFFAGLTFDPPLDLVGPPLTREIVNRLDFLERVGLGYLSLDRAADSLSGGELQRVRLATQIGSGLVGVCYVLDEPTAGLHPRDTDRLLASLRDLRDQGNSVVVVEHDEATIRAADWLIDLGPGAGPDGGRIVALGPPNHLPDAPESLTARHLRHEAARPLQPGGRLARSRSAIKVLGAEEHNLKGIDVTIPVGTLTCVTGVSGSGKSTLINEILARSVRRALDRAGPRPGAHDQIAGLDAIDKLIEVDQSPIGRGPRSTPGTYTGVYDEIRKVFAQTREAKIRGYGPSRFSFNVKGGRCEACEGQGVRRVEMQFLADLYVVCDACRGQRFNRQTLEVRFKGKSIGDVLDMRVDEARLYFDAHPKVRRALDALHEAGLGYVTLGQSSTTLSGGEAQRVKLAAELGRVDTGRTLYILDEPTTGLHFADVARLLSVLHHLADLGNTLVVIEHNLDVIRTADWVIDLGPDGGEAGGQVVAMGPPQNIAEVAASYTGQYLKRIAIERAAEVPKSD